MQPGADSFVAVDGHFVQSTRCVIPRIRIVVLVRVRTGGDVVPGDGMYLAMFWPPVPLGATARTYFRLEMLLLETYIRKGASRLSIRTQAVAVESQTDDGGQRVVEIRPRLLASDSVFSFVQKTLR